MTHVKKSLALLLAFVMIFSSMSVAASAWDPTVDGGFALNFNVKFYRMERNEDGLIIDRRGDVICDENDKLLPEYQLEWEDGYFDLDTDVNWIETTKAKPGEEVRARVYMGTDFIAGSSNIMASFDSDMLVPTADENIKIEGSYPKNNFFRTYASSMSYNWTTDENRFDRGWLETLPAGFMDGKDLIMAEIASKSPAVLSGLTDKDWALNFPMKVIDGEAANTVNYVAEVAVPEELMASPSKNINPTTVSKFETTGSNTGIGSGMFLWDAKVDTKPGKLTTTGNFILDSNGGSFNGEKTALASGIIGKQINGFGDAKPTMSGYIFRGYTDVPVDKDHIITAEVATKLGLDSSSIGDYLTDDQFNQLLILPEDYSDYTYDYEDQKVYAAWTKSEATSISYDFEVYQLKVGGKADNKDDYVLVSTVPVETKPGAEAWMPAFPMEGFSLNTELSDDRMIITDDSSKFKHYYARNEYKVTYHYEDASEMPQTETYTVQYQATVPDCKANPGKPGFTFKGWSLNSDNTIKAVPEIMPANNMDIYPVLEDEVYTYVFNASGDEAGNKGMFPDGNFLKSYTYIYYGDAFIYEVPDPVKAGSVFTGWEPAIPDAANGDMTFNATYMKETYEASFVDAKNPSLNHKVYKQYGEKVTVADMPEGYTTAGWSADGGTSLINFPYEVKGDVTFTATETAGYIDAIFMADGKEYKRIPVKIGEVIPAPEENPVKYGYDFIDWHPNVGGDDGAIMDTDGATFDAIFEPKTSTITFDTAGGTEIPSITGKFGTDVIAPTTIPEREGYKFLRWNVAIPETMPAEDMTIEAVWAPETYKIDYFLDKDGALIESVIYEFDEIVRVPANPSKTGYEFAGWDVQIPGKMPANNLVINATWTANEYTITFDENGGSEVEDIKEPYGTAITAPVTSLKNNIFKGWALADDATKTVIAFPSTMPAENMNLVAVWEAEKIDVIFNANGGNFSDGTATEKVEDVPVGSDIDTFKPSEEPIRLGFLFGGWNEVGLGMYEAIWNPDPNYDITYTINIIAINPATGEEIAHTPVKGTANNGQTVEIVADRANSAADIIYTFDELAPSKNYVVDENKTTETLISVAVDGENEITVYFIPATITVEFLANGGTFADGTDKKTLTGENGDVLTAPDAPTRKGYTFAGWDKELTQTFTADTTYIAKWTKAVNNAIFNVKNADGEIIDTITVPYEYGAAVEAPEYDKVGDGQTFTGWVVPEGTTMGAGDMTFNATLSYVEYTITYVYTGAVPAGAVTPASQKVSLEEGNNTVTIATPDSVLGYIFTGWNDETGKDYVPGSEFTLEEAASIILYGSWTPIPVNPVYKELTYVYDGEIPADAPALPEAENIEVGTVVTVADVPSVDGYTFKGWYKNGVLTESFVMPNEAVELKGIWTKDYVAPEPEEYEVSYVYTGTVPANADDLPEAFMAVEGSTVTTADLPAAVDGYTFAGWYVNGKLTESFVMPSADVEIEGRWTKNPVPGEYKITYVYTGEVPATAAELPAESFAAENTPVFTAKVPEAVEGYTFSGWYVNGVLTESFLMPSSDVVIEGNWTKNPVAPEPDEFTVTYKYTGAVPVNAPALPETETVAEGKTVKVAKTPDAVVGYDFAGWYYNGVLTESFVMPSENVTIEGVWTKNGEYSVSYMYGGNDVGLEIPEAAYDVLPVDENGYLPGETVTVADKPVVNGYTFHGWYYNGIRYDGELASEFDMPNHNVVMVGLWTKDVENAFNVSYSYIGEAPENAPALPAIQTAVEVGTTVTVADVPTLDGYTFDGWYYGDEIVTSFEMPAEDVVLIGAWSKDEVPVEEYNVTYKYEGTVPAGAPAAPVDTNKYEEGEGVTVKALPVLEGYEFTGWTYNGTDYAAGETVTMPAADIEFIGTWTEIVVEPETYTVTYEYTGTVPAGAPAVPVDANEYEEGDNVTVAAVPSLDGYTFSGWYYNNTITTNFEMPASDVVVTGEWVEDLPDTYTITYTYTGNVPENSPAVPGIATAAEGEEITVAAVPSLDGYTFDGWYYDGAIVDKFTMPANDVIITGSWSAVKYDLVIDANRGAFADGSEEFVDSLAAGEKINAPADPTREGYDLAGWEDQDGNRYDKIPETMPKGDTTFTAVWVEQETPKHTITYYLVKGGDVYANGTYAEGETMTHPVAGEIDGIIYDGWVDENGNPIQSVMGSSDLVAYAVAVGVKDYKATFIVDGTVYHEAMIGAGTAMYPHIPGDPTKEGYVFSGWVDADGKSPENYGVMPAKDLEFRAMFIKEPVDYVEYIARYVVDDETYRLYVLEEGDIIPVPEDPQKFGFKFVGWEPEVPATMPGEDVEFVAQWEIDKTFVTVVIGGAVVAGGVIAGIAGANAAWITGVSIVGGIIVIVGAAHLIKHTHTVTYIVDGEVYKTYKVIEGTKIPVPADPAKEGAEFKGWEPEVPERMGNTDLVFEATWADIAGEETTEPDSGDEEIDIEIPATGSVAGLAAFAVISGAAAAAYVFARKKKED